MPVNSQTFRGWLAGTPEDDVLRWLFRALVVATVGVAVLDFQTLEQTQAERGSPATQKPAAEPLPSTLREGVVLPRVAPNAAELGKAMTFELGPNGRLAAVGTITPGTSQAFAQEIAKRGAYVKTVVLESPGGSVQDALAMGRLIREKGLSTEVDAGRYCASSCPLVFAGGIERRARTGSAIGVHQVAAIGDEVGGATGMDQAQRVSARCQTYLREMGVDLQVWVRAMETPHNRLYYFKPDELRELRLVTAEGTGT